MNKNIRKIVWGIAAVLVVIAIGFSIGKRDREIIILDEKGDRYYKIVDDIVLEKDGTMIIKDNGFVDSLINELINDMKIKFGYSKDKAIKELNKEDYIIRSTVDPELQEIVDNKFKIRSVFTETKKNEFNQAAMVITDYKGNIKAVASGNNSDTKKNRATESLIKVGSTIKPIAIYTPAIENRVINFSTMIPDIQGTTLIGGELAPWPSNYDGVYEGEVTTTEALQKSKNTTAVAVGEMIGEEEIYNFLKNELNYKTMVEEDKQLAALALGYFNRGLSLDVLVNSYGIFGNGGEYNEPKLYTEIMKNNKVIIEKNEVGKQVISEETATIVNRLLYNNITAKGSIIKNIKIDNIEIIGKTGTVGNDNGDSVSSLFIGMTPEYVAGVWIGFDSGIPLQRDLYNGAGVVWQQIMEEVKYEKEKFILSNKVKKLDYCPKSGMLVTDTCNKGVEGYYVVDENIERCNICK